MRGLSGDVGTMPIKDLVVYLGNRKVSGALTLERGAVRKDILLRDGQVLNVSSNEPREHLGQFLINMGHITEDQFNRAYLTQQETKVYLGKILCMIGAVSEETVTAALALKFRETLLEPFLWTEGSFHFQNGATLPMPDGIDLSLDLLDLHREGEFRETAWAAIRGVFPSDDLRLALHVESFPEPPAPGSLDARISALVEGGSTLAELVLALHATDFFLFQRLFALHRLGVLTVAVPAGELLDFDALGTSSSATGIGSEPTAEEIVTHAETFLAEGNHDAAETLAQRAHQLAPSPRTTDLVRRAEAARLGELRTSLMSGKKIPSLIVPPAKLRTMQMSAPERYLLSRIDGTREVAAIVHVSPLREIEALKFLQRFLDAGLIRVA